MSSHNHSQLDSDEERVGRERETNFDSVPKQGPEVLLNGLKKKNKRVLRSLC